MNQKEQQIQQSKKKKTIKAQRQEIKGFREKKRAGGGNTWRLVYLPSKLWAQPINHSGDSRSTQRKQGAGLIEENQRSGMGLMLPEGRLELFEI